MSLEQIGGTHYCSVCGEEDYPAIHVCVKALQRGVSVCNHFFLSDDSECSNCHKRAGNLLDDANAELTRLRAENEELRKALEPFAIDSDPTEHSDDDTIGAEFTWGQCRRAAELLNRKTP